MTDTLDQLLRDAAPVTDQQVRALALDEVEAELREALVAERRPGPAKRSPRRRRSLRLGLSGLGAAAVAAVAVVIVSLAGGGEQLGTSPERAWAKSALRVANAVPRLLIGEPGWSITRADEFMVDEGEMTFRKGSASVDLHWRAGSFRDWVKDRDNSADELPSVEVLGASARVFRYQGPFDDYTALWRSGSYTMEFRTGYPPRLSLAEYRRLLGSLKTTGVDDWLAAMPPSVVLPANTGRTVEAMLAGIPLPPGFDKAALKRDAAVRDRYQLGARVAGAVACGWIERWVEARRAGDTAAAAEAVEAMQTSRRWPILLEMRADGEYPAVLWNFAAAMQGRARVPAGKPTTVERAYRPALGC
ncbi:MAG: hypothetical protein QOH58_2383 [Thermoleophilaceae bacterium]|nr:hypothetical protein [Thermoleophilaceae bacterium]